MGLSTPGMSKPWAGGQMGPMASLHAAHRQICNPKEMRICTPALRQGILRAGEAAHTTLYMKVPMNWSEDHRLCVH